MGISTEKYIKKPLYVDAVRVTTANFDEICSWCQGKIETEETPSGKIRKYIAVRVHNPKNFRQRQAFVGDWLLYTEMGYKVYNHKAFHASFEIVEAEAQAKADAELDTPLSEEEEIELVDATPEAIADVVNEQQPMGGIEDKEVPEIAADKRVLTEEEQAQMGPDEVREAVSSGDVVLAQDLS